MVCGRHASSSASAELTPDSMAVQCGARHGVRRLRLRLDISYDGTDFSGWAIQPGLRTVAGELTDALQMLLRDAGPAGGRRADRRRGARHRAGRARGRRPPTRSPPCAPRALRRLAGGSRGRPRRRLRAGCCAGWPGCCRPTSGSARSHRAAPGFRRPVLRAAPALPLPDRHRRVGRRTGRPARTCWPVAGRWTSRRWRWPPPALIGLRDFAAFCRPREGATHRSATCRR